MKKLNNQNFLFFMKKSFSQKIALLMCFILSFTLLTGCSNSDSVSGNSSSTSSSNSQVIMTIQGTDVTMSEVYLFLVQYLINNQPDPDTLKDQASQQDVLDQVISELQLETVEYLVATNEGITVSDNAITSAQATADSYYDYCGGESFFAPLSVTKEDVDTLFEHQVYLNQLQSDSIDDLTDEYMTQMADEYADAKLDKVYYAVFPTISYDDDGNPVTDDNGDYEKLSDDEIAQAKANADEFLQRVKAGESMEDLVEEYDISLNSASDYYYEGSGEDVIDDAISSLSDNDISDVVDTSVGYMIVRMDKHDDSDYKDYVVKLAASQQASNSYPNMQEYWKKAAGLSSVTVDTDTVYSIDVHAIAEDFVNRGVYSLSE